jgi:phosphoribosylglycinamide formyltransferase-1
MPMSDPPSPATVPRVALLVSGRGSNLQAIARAAASQAWPARLALVLAHREDIPAVQRARELGLPVRILPLNPALDRPAQDAQISQCLEEAAIDWIVLAGYMRILSPAFVRRHAGRLVNIHPSLLPAFPGLHTHRQALAAGVKLHGATVHLVDEAVDAGPILAQAAVPVLPDDDEAALAARVLQAEHRLYPPVLRALIEGRLALSGKRARWIGASPAADPLLLWVPVA